MLLQMENVKTLYLRGIRDGEVEEVVPDRQELTNSGKF